MLLKPEGSASQVGSSLLFFDAILLQVLSFTHHIFYFHTTAKRDEKLHHLHFSWSVSSLIKVYEIILGRGKYTVPENFRVGGGSHHQHFEEHWSAKSSRKHVPLHGLYELHLSRVVVPAKLRQLYVSFH